MTSKLIRDVTIGGFDTIDASHGWPLFANNQITRPDELHMGMVVREMNYDAPDAELIVLTPVYSDPKTQDLVVLTWNRNTGEYEEKFLADEAVVPYANGGFNRYHYIVHTGVEIPEIEFHRLTRG